MLKLKVLNWSLCLLQKYAPNATSEYRAFGDKANNVLFQASPTDSTVFMGNFYAYIGTDM